MRLSDKKAISIPTIHVVASIQKDSKVTVLTAIADIELTFQSAGTAGRFIESMNGLRVAEINHKPPELTVAVRITPPEPKEIEF